MKKLRQLYFLMTEQVAPLNQFLLVIQRGRYMVLQLVISTKMEQLTSLLHAQMLQMFYTLVPSNQKIGNDLLNEWI